MSDDLCHPNCAARRNPNAECVCDQLCSYHLMHGNAGKPACYRPAVPDDSGDPPLCHEHWQQQVDYAFEVARAAGRAAPKWARRHLN